MAFYNQTLSAVNKVYHKVEKLGVPIKRPPDYFCEHVKSDGHMSKVINSKSAF
jgi:rRNA-processing protein EBP2